MLGALIAHAPSRARSARAARDGARRDRLLGRDDEPRLPRPRPARRRRPRGRVRHDVPRPAVRRRRRARRHRRRRGSRRSPRPRSPCCRASRCRRCGRAGRRRRRSTRSCRSTSAARARRWHLRGTRAAFDARCGDAIAPRRRPGDVAAMAATSKSTRPSTAVAVRVAALFDGAAAHWQAEGAELAAIDLRLRGRQPRRGGHLGPDDRAAARPRHPGAASSPAVRSRRAPCSSSSKR